MPKKEKIDPRTGEIIDLAAPFTADDPAPYLRSYGMRPIMLNDHGHEIPDPTPMAPPVGFKPQPSMVEIVRAQIAGERLRQEAEAAGLETFEEADDFDVQDDFDPSSPYEEMFDPAPARPRFRTAQEEIDPERPHHKERQDFKANPDKYLKPKKQKAPETASVPSRTPKAPDPVLDGPEE